jgi:hypothetical protein
MTSQSPSPVELQPRIKRRLPNLLLQGFQLVLRNWPCVIWAYAVSLILSLLASVPFATGLTSYLDHSLAAQRIAGTIDVSYLAELGIHLREANFAPMAIRTAGWLNLLQLLVLFVFFAGSIFVYVSAEPPRLSVLLRGGVAYFWRFVRAAIVAVVIGGIVLGILLGARAALLNRAGAVYLERQMFLCSAISAALVLVVFLLLRLWWDLVEVYIVRNAMDGERRVRQALLPAFRLLLRYFFRTFGSSLLIAIAGLSAFALCLFLWKLLPANQVVLAFLLAQLGLFLLLVSRFWQRGLEATLVMSGDPPRIAQEEMASEDLGAFVEEVIPSSANVEMLASLSEPTLRDLVQKLRHEPWANPEALSDPLSRSLPATEAAPPAKADDPSTSLLERHETKFPLGGPGAAEEVPPVDLPEEPKTEELTILEDREKTPHSEKRPLP